ncbi:hypothetical protein SAURM35S_07231 [Streptomyces aurantiogriseus]
MFEKPTSTFPLSMPMNRFSQVDRRTSGSRPRTAATSRPRSTSEPVSVFWSLPTKPSGGLPDGSVPDPITSLPLFFRASGSSALMDFTSETFRVVSLAAPLDSRPTVTVPAASVVLVAASLSPPQAASPVARVATAVAVVMPRIRLRRENWVGMAVLVVRSGWWR